ncbi:syntaxin binding protein 1 [Malassezia pachydermatis]
MPAKSLQTLVKQRYLDALNTVQPANRWKNLIVDSHTMQYLSVVIRMFDILEQNVTHVENIEKMRDPQPHIESMYLLCATSQNVDRLIKELAPPAGQPPQCAAAHVFFVDAISDELVTKLTNSAAGPRLRQLVELFINLWPIESQVFSLKHPSSFFTLFQPMDTKFAPSMDESLALLQDELDMATQSLLNLCVTLNENPKIRYLNVPGKVLGPLSAEAQADTIEGTFAADDLRKGQGEGRVQIGMPFTQQLALRVQDALDEYCKNGQMLGDPGRPQGILFITDRSMDLFSPFLHEFTYQAMVYDLLPMTDGKYKHTYTNAEGEKEVIEVELNEEDETWTKIRHLHIAEAIEYLTREFQLHMGETAQFSGTQSIDGMRDMLASLPHMQQTKEKLSVHLSLAQQCMNKFEKSKLAAQAMVEQNTATNQTPDGHRPRSLVEDMVPILDDPSISNGDKVRIIALYILQCDGVHEEDRRRLFQHARLTGGEAVTINNLAHLGARVVREQSQSSLDAIFRKRRKTLAPKLPAAGQAEYELSRFQPLIRTMIEDHAMDRLEQSMFPYVRDAPPEAPLSSQIASRSASITSSATDMATSMLHSAIHATGGKDSPLARVGFGFDGSSSSRNQSLRTGTTSLRSARPTWHQKGRSESVPNLSTTGVGAGATTAGARTTSRILTESSNPTSQRVLVYMAGGMTYSEMRTAYQVGKRINADVYLGSSHVITPTNFMDNLRVMGTPRQPVSPDLHVEARRKAQEAELEQIKAIQEGKKPPKGHMLKKPKYPQELPPQQRYDLRYSTPDTVSAEESKPQIPEKSTMRRISENVIHKTRDNSESSLSPPSLDPLQSANSTRRGSSMSLNSDTSKSSSLSQGGRLPTRPKWGRDMSRFKSAFSIKK